MALALIEYLVRPGASLACRVTSPAGSRLELEGELGSSPHTTLAEGELGANPALVAELWAFGVHEKNRRRLRAAEKRASHAKQAQVHARRACELAKVMDRLTEEVRQGWCSSCLTCGPHRWARMNRPGTPTYACCSCGTLTTKCAAPWCQHMAIRGMSNLATPRYCAEHRHDLPGFEKANEVLADLADYAHLLEYESPNLGRHTRKGAFAVAGTALLAVTLGAAAPAIGGALGASSLATSSGLTGAAAVSHGLAMLGGGSIASGGMGMAGGVLVIQSAGGLVGGAVGAGLVSAYTAEDKSFRIEKLKDGTGTPVIVANGFLTEGSSGWAEWRQLVERRYPGAPVYRVYWGAKELKGLGLFAGLGAAKPWAGNTVRAGAMRAAKKSAGRVGPIGWGLAAADLAMNPWHTAVHRAERTGIALAGLLARTEGTTFVLVGHSLGARVMATTAQALATEGGPVKIETVHLLGAAIGRKQDWRLLSEATHDGVFNYWSSNDAVLKHLYRFAQAGSTPVGLAGFRSKFETIRDRNVSRKVTSHGAYLEHVRLAPD